ncbi:hypothetical protein RRG08_033606 [Elysia crispata]|uniref:Uncharacterized protein n=1 Tax=Elysia crispata TaxID=231223 RepID=A0AAE1CKT5_9GAST|nr:hypothetical protein RRG08_033606 [Elysia crispata]
MCRDSKVVKAPFKITVYLPTPQSSQLFLPPVFSHAQYLDSPVSVQPVLVPIKYVAQHLDDLKTKIFTEFLEIIETEKEDSKDKSPAGGKITQLTLI